MKLKKLLIFILILLVLPITIAQPFTQSSTDVAGKTLDLIIPKNPGIIKDLEFDFHLHVFNSNGTLMTNTTVDKCMIHIYNDTGNHIIKQELEFHTTEWEILIPTNATARLGYYSYLVYCNSTSEEGFFSGEYLVTNDGTINFNKDSTPLSIILIGLLFFIWMAMNTINIKDDNGNFVAINILIKTALGGFSILILFLIIQFSYGISRMLDFPPYLEANLSELYRFTLYILILFGILVLLGYTLNFFANILNKGKK